MIPDSLNQSPVEEKQSGLDKLAKGDMPDGTNITKVIVNGYVDGALITGAWYIGPAASVGKVVGGALVAEIANGTYQWFDLSQPSNEKKNWDYTGSLSAGVTGALAPGRGVWKNVGIAGGSAIFTDGANSIAIGSSVAGAAVGGLFGKYAPGFIEKSINKELPSFAYDLGGSFIYEVTNGAAKEALKPSDNKGSKNGK